MRAGIFSSLFTAVHLSPIIVPDMLYVFNKYFLSKSENENKFVNEKFVMHFKGSSYNPLNLLAQGYLCFPIKCLLVTLSESE